MYGMPLICPPWRPLPCNSSRGTFQCHRCSAQIRLITNNVLSGSWIARRIGRKEERAMPIAKITGQGLSAMGLAVALLWGCLIGERVITRDAIRERVRVVRELEQMRLERHASPASVPLRRRAGRSPMALG